MLKKNKLITFSSLLLICAILVFSMTSLFAKSARQPEITKGMPKNFNEGSDLFDARVKQTFPDGTSSAELVEFLKVSGFTIKEDAKPDDHYAVWTKQSFPCVLDWMIFWHQMPNGEIKNIKASYSGTCP